jgi:hypothetical protein
MGRPALALQNAVHERAWYAGRASEPLRHSRLGGRLGSNQRDSFSLPRPSKA